MLYICDLDMCLHGCDVSVWLDCLVRPGKRLAWARRQSKGKVYWIYIASNDIYPSWGVLTYDVTCDLLLFAISL